MKRIRRRFAQFEKWFFTREIKYRSVRAEMAWAWVPMLLVSFVPVILLYGFGFHSDYVSGVCLGTSFGGLWMAWRARRVGAATMEEIHGKGWRFDASLGRVVREQAEVAERVQAEQEEQRLG